MSGDLRVGIIGANARGGWAGEAHVPAIQGLDGLMLAAVATNRQETADEAAHAFGVDRAYSSGAALIADPEIDIVTVATRVPDHHALVLAAIAAGKHVYSEWPLGRGSAESEEMAKAAAEAGVHHAIGLQLRGSGAVCEAQRRIAAGDLGRVLSVSAFSSTAGFGPDVPASFVYLEDPTSFANLVTIQGAHTLDLLLALGGSIRDMRALLSRQYPDILLGDEKIAHRRETYDHLVAQGRFASGTPFTVEVAGGRKGDTPFWLEVRGERTSLRLLGGAPRGLQSGRIDLIVDGEPIAPAPQEGWALPDAAANVAGVYLALVNDIHDDTHRVTGFDHAVGLSYLIEQVLQSADDTVAA